ncbi:hypothetical protein DFA_02564 [Cavenderia fasciculata]|uniref:Uncharacterized protein n=1 Tax=Cavenderia fasciculata TaxID=261658 RepID=F4PZR1_CACFS|nr:uncharacterized protein DFA_02564 [Cavenderia fasciculata]EGG18825.1 hypothetical protein DFA_02564 [Cavenderia fasciculata]|eukprot:XP_004357287.1 hypothetical protein DFA_02564 [Cavenderia fasciculata]
MNHAYHITYFTHSNNNQNQNGVAEAAFPYIIKDSYIIKHYDSIDCTGEVNQMIHLEPGARDVCYSPYEYFMDCEKGSRKCHFGFSCQCKKNCSKLLQVGECFIGYKLFYEPLDYKNQDWCLISTIKLANNHPELCRSRPDGIHFSRKHHCAKTLRYDFDYERQHGYTIKSDCDIERVTFHKGCNSDCSSCPINATLRAPYCFSSDVPGGSDYLSSFGDYWWFYKAVSAVNHNIKSKSWQLNPLIFNLFKIIFEEKPSNDIQIIICTTAVMIFRNIFKRFSTEGEESDKKSNAKRNIIWFSLISASSFLVFLTCSDIPIPFIHSFIISSLNDYFLFE